MDVGDVMMAVFDALCCAIILFNLCFLDNGHVNCIGTSWWTFTFGYNALNKQHGKVITKYLLMNNAWINVSFTLRSILSFQLSHSKQKCASQYKQNTKIYHVYSLERIEKRLYGNKWGEKDKNINEDKKVEIRWWMNL